MKWYCIHTKPQRESYALEQLSGKLAFEVYFPRLRREKVIRRVRRVVTEALFPGYIFCRFDLATKYRAVRYARDVIDVLRFGPNPAVVSEHLISELKEWADRAAIMKPRPMFSLGERVAITEGPMRGLEAVIMEERCGGDRVAVLLSILGREAQLTINRCQLAKAS